MKTSHTIEHEIKFSVQYFASTEGGMDNETFGLPVDTLNEALHLITLANTTRPNEPWIIVGEVKTKIKP